MNFSIYAITPQLPDKSAEMIESHSLGFSMLSDPENTYAASLGIRHDLPTHLQTIYQSLGIDLPKSNGDPSWTLPMPARLVVDKSGIVRKTDADPDYSKRPEPGKTLDDVRAVANA